MVVDRDEPVRIVRHPADLPALDPGQAEHGVGLDRLARGQRQAAVLEADRGRAGHHLDAPFGQQLGDALARAAAEEAER